MLLHGEKVDHDPDEYDFKDFEEPLEIRQQKEGRFWNVLHAKMLNSIKKGTY